MPVSREPVKSQVWRQAGILCKMPRKKSRSQVRHTWLWCSNLKASCRPRASGASIAYGKVLVTDSISELENYCKQTGLFLDIR